MSKYREKLRCGCVVGTDELCPIAKERWEKVETLMYADSVMANDVNLVIAKNKLAEHMLENGYIPNQGGHSDS